MAKALLISCLIAVATAQLIDKYIQHVSLYKGLGCEGPGIKFKREEVPDLNKYDWADSAFSAKVTGAWLFYSLPHYNPDGNGSMEYIFGIDLCGNFGSLAGQVNSIRSAGPLEDYRDNGLSIYKESYYQGHEEYLQFQPFIRDFNMKEHNSIIGVGTMGWTLYDEPDFKGHSACLLYSEDFKPFHMFFFPNLEKYIPEMFNKIRSIRAGCFKK